MVFILVLLQGFVKKQYLSLGGKPVAVEVVFQDLVEAVLQEVERFSSSKKIYMKESDNKKHGLQWCVRM